MSPGGLLRHERPIIFCGITMIVGLSWVYIWQGAGMGSAEGQTVELEAQTEAWNEARRLALGRLSEEARRAGADAVVGVRVKRGNYDWATNLIEFVAIGTAVVSEKYELGEAS